MPSDDFWRERSSLYAGIKERTELAGVIEGFLADSISIEEVVYLAAWLRDNERCLGAQLVALIEELDDLLALGELEQKDEASLRLTLEETKELCYANTDVNLVDDEEFPGRVIGFLKGITADQIISTVELAQLHKLLHSASGNPFAEAIKRTISLYGDDPAQLFRSLCAIAGHDPSSGVVGGLSIGGIFDDPRDPSEIKFSGSCFSFTGTCKFGPRSRCAERMYALGADFHKNPKWFTDYLVVGSIATKAWSGVNYGGKIEYALETRLSKSRQTNNRDPLKIISEHAWDQAARIAESRRTIAAEVDPDTYFLGWSYPPNRAQRPALGVELRERINKERKKAARARARADGMNDKKVANIRVTEMVWTAKQPPTYDFHVGDLFHGVRNETSVQVADDGEPLEVHSNQSGVWSAYQLSQTDLAHWLRTGVEPRQCRISPEQCQRELHRFILAAEEQKRGTDEDCDT